MDVSRKQVLLGFLNLFVGLFAMTAPFVSASGQPVLGLAIGIASGTALMLIGMRAGRSFHRYM